MKNLFFILLVCFSLQLNAQTNLTQAVDFTVTDVHGNSFNLFDKLDEGFHVVVDFFFTTCGPCIDAVPTLNDAYNQYGCNKEQVYFISIDDRNNDAAVVQFESDYGSLLPAVSGVDGGGAAVVSAYNVGAFPTVILIAPDKSILSQDIYPVSTIFTTFGQNGLTEVGCSGVSIRDIQSANDGETRIFDFLGREWHIPFKDLPKGLYIVNGEKRFKSSIY